MLLSKYKRKPEAWNKHAVLHLESEAASFSADTAHPFRLIPWLLELDSGRGSVKNMSFPGYTKGLGYLLSDLRDKTWPIIRLERKWEAKVRDDFLNKNLCCLWRSFWPCWKNFNPPWKGIHLSEYEFYFMCRRYLSEVDLPVFSWYDLVPDVWGAKELALEFSGVRWRNKRTGVSDLLWGEKKLK